MAGGIFNEFAILLSLSVVIGFIAIKLRQPLILSFIIVGILVGPNFFGWISAHSELEVLASFGITLLLFIVGLKLDLHLIKTLGTVTLLVGLGQILLTFFAGYLLCLLLGMTSTAAFFIAAALTFSSTIIIIKVLSDRFEIDSLYGRMSVGILIIQDLVVVIAIIVLSSLKLPYYNTYQLSGEVLLLIGKGIGFLIAIGLVANFILPVFLEHLAKSRELLILFAISWAVILAVLAETLGFSKEVGGFIAGVSLASSKYKEAIASRLETVRNLLILFFFLNLGASLKLTGFTANLLIGFALSFFVLIIKPLIVMLIMSFFRFRKRTSFLTGLTMGQISEFSLLLASLGTRLGYIDKNVESLITLIALITIGVSTYIIAYSNQLFLRFKTWLSPLERTVKYREDSLMTVDGDHFDVIIYGFGRHGEQIAKLLEKNGLSILAIDFDPNRVKLWPKNKIQIRYGDAEDVEFVKTLPLIGVKWIVSTIPHKEANKILVTSLKERNYQGKIALSAYHDMQLESLQKLNVDMIFVPFRDAAKSAACKLVEVIQKDSL